jgi:hypothetical protein
MNLPFRFPSTIAERDAAGTCETCRTAVVVDERRSGITRREASRDPERADLLATVAALRENADAYHWGRIDHETHGRRNRALWDGVHRSDQDELTEMLRRPEARP